MDLLSLSEEEVGQIHEKYMELESLNQTIVWIEENFNLSSVNRHQLSLFFKKRNLEVLPPNGRSVGEWRVVNQYYSPESELAAAMLTQAIKDVEKYRNGRGKAIDFLSACYFFAGDRYRNVLAILNNGKYNLESSNLPEGVSAHVIRAGTNLYADQYNYWVRGIA